jgi:hypothetical protein
VECGQDFEVTSRKDQAVKKSVSLYRPYLCELLVNQQAISNRWPISPRMSSPFRKNFHSGTKTPARNVLTA